MSVGLEVYIVKSFLHPLRTHSGLIGNNLETEEDVCCQILIVAFENKQQDKESHAMFFCKWMDLWL